MSPLVFELPEGYGFDFTHEEGDTAVFPVTLHVSAFHTLNESDKTVFTHVSSLRFSSTHNSCSLRRTHQTLAKPATKNTAPIAANATPAKTKSRLDDAHDESTIEFDALGGEAVNGGVGEVVSEEKSSGWKEATWGTVERDAAMDNSRTRMDRLATACCFMV